MRAEQILPQMSLLVLLLMFDNEGHSRLAEGKTLQKVSSFTCFWNQDRLHLVLLPVKCPKSKQILRNPPKWLKMPSQRGNGLPRNNSARKHRSAGAVNFFCKSANLKTFEVALT